VYETYNAAGLLSAAEPGWHVRADSLPESVEIAFEQEQTITAMSLLPQDGFPVRGPKRVQLEVAKADAWEEVLTVEDACPGTVNRWRTFPLDQPLKTSRVRLVVSSNCGDPGLMTIRGLKFE
jgi:hypothetical protein